jgi:hypothetical protein
LFLTRRFAGDQPIKRGLPADDAINHFLAEAAVGGRKLDAGECGIEQIFGEFTGSFALAQNAGSNLSWIFVVQFV